ncbi:MAG TPA: glycosyltransferase family 4 protein, partial [Candidatus Saccharimonadales bacterium]|nr:glycosyltransferase family 4 protein [Candidatus Saccharimonadales bacterium]
YTVTHLDPGRFEPLLVTGSEGVLVEEAQRSGVKTYLLDSLVRPVSPVRDLRAGAALVSLLRRERPAIVHTHSSKAGILGRLAAAAAGVPVIVHSVHGWGFHPGQSRAAYRLFVAAERLASRTTTAWVCVSRANLRQGEALRILREDQARLIRSGIRLETFRPRDGGGTAPEGGAVVGMVACFKPQKAPLDFIEVAGRVHREEPSARFVLAGDGELRGDIEDRVHRAGLDGVVALPGWRRDIPELMRSFDVLVHTARWEGLPRVLPEAMATGLPIVATRVDGSPEAVEDGANGLLFEPGDTEAMAAAVIGLIRDPERRRRMGEEGRARVGEWDIDGMVRSQERLYEDLLEGRAAGEAA